MRTVVFDLDQTLLRAEAIDWSIWLAAVAEVLGVAVPEDENWAAHPVHTDHGLLESLSRNLRGRPCGDAERARFEALLFDRLDALLAEDPGLFVPVAGAVEVVEVLAPRAALATGNLHAVTLRKVRSAGLRTLPCSCSAPGIDRTTLVRRALERAGWSGGPATSFGDGVWDVRAARALGVGFVGVAQTDAHERRLRDAGARHVVRDFTDLAEVVRLADAADPPLPEADAGAWHTPREG